ncbi:hypothetical protein [Hymenobacter pini]|uniref:hypothetical protein n=1 Tax=Hymenobacter pini TaxID=2880879 RepID=UPI001CF2E8E0|nr:hypothetical protein [Hymenobacter pini]MCA8831567.1 hypothetical protein [Hymenobacter pini]
MARILTLLTGCLLASLLAYGASVAVFRAQQRGSSVLLEWQAPRAAIVKDYEVWRRDYPADDFDRLVVLSSTAQQQYRYTDLNMLRSTLGRGPVTYRLAVRTATGTYTYLTSPVQSEDNVVLRSWDTIKQMFR